MGNKSTQETISSFSDGDHNNMVVNGYIKRLQNTLTKRQIIPLEVIQLCIDFYCSRIILIYIDQGTSSSNNNSEPFQLSITDFTETSRKYDAKITPSNIPSTQPTPPREPNLIHNAHIYFTKNINLPSKICTELNTNERTQFDVIFRYGGNKMCVGNPSSSCNALIWQSNIRRHGNKQKTLNIIDYELPQCPPYLLYANIIYSQRYSTLYALGSSVSSQPSIAKLNMNIDRKNMEWKTIDNGRIETRTSCILVEKDYDEQILVFETIRFHNTSGDEDSIHSKVKQYNLNDDTVSELKVMGSFPTRHNNGILYDGMDKRVYIGGGHAIGCTTQEIAAHSVVCMDLVKMKWFDAERYIPKTLLNHDHYPILWKDGDLLYIASVKGEGIEWIDMRDDNRKWNMYKDSLNTYFDTDIHSYNAFRCRLLR